MGKMVDGQAGAQMGGWANRRMDRWWMAARWLAEPWVDVDGQCLYGWVTGRLGEMWRGRADGWVSGWVNRQLSKQRHAQAGR